MRLSSLRQRHADRMTTSVVVVLDSTNLAPGHSAMAHAVAKDQLGNVLAGKTPSWQSATPSVATVSSTGQLTAISTGDGSDSGHGGRRSWTGTSGSYGTGFITDSAPGPVAGPSARAGGIQSAFPDNVGRFAAAHDVRAERRL